MEQALRPHRGGTVLALGILSAALPLAILGLAFLGSRLGVLFIPMGALILPLGIITVVNGAREVSGMKAAQIDPSGARLARAGQALGTLGVLVWIATLIGCYVVLANSELVATRIEGPSGVQTRSTLQVGQSPLGPPPDFFVECEFEYEGNEVLRADGKWVKDGPAVRWNRTHTIKLEEGNYLDGKREGEWIFRDEDGSVDPDCSGIYEHDVRVKALPPPVRVL